jgi:putative transposase
MTTTTDHVVVQAVEPVVEQKLEAETGSDLARLLDGDVVARLTKQAQAAGIPLSGEGGLLAQLTKMVLETALQGEMDAHLGYGKHEPAGRNGGNSRNGVRSKTVVTDVGPVEIEVPRDRDASFTPQVVAKRQRRLSGVDDLVISLTARGLTSGEICAHLAEVYGTRVSKETISVITDRMLDTMAEWQARPLDVVYPVLFVDCIYMKIREGQVANRPVYVVLGVTCDGGSDVLGLWVGDSTGEGAKFWLRVLTEIRNRGVADVCICWSVTGSRVCPRSSRRCGPRRWSSSASFTEAVKNQRGVSLASMDARTAAAVVKRWPGVGVHPCWSRMGATSRVASPIVRELTANSSARTSRLQMRRW